LGCPAETYTVEKGSHGANTWIFKSLKNATAYGVVCQETSERGGNRSTRCDHDWKY